MHFKNPRRSIPSPLWSNLISSSFFICGFLSLVKGERRGTCAEPCPPLLWTTCCCPALLEAAVFYSRNPLPVIYAGPSHKSGINSALRRSPLVEAIARAEGRTCFFGGSRAV